MKYTNNDGISVDCSPFFDNGCGFQKLHMYEEIGGTLAYGELFMMLDGSAESIETATKTDTGTITICGDAGNIITAPFFIVDRQMMNNVFNIRFVCSPNKKFHTVYRTVTWENESIKDIINKIYPGKKEFRDNCDSDVSNGLTFYQERQTDHEFLTYLCYSFKHDIIFCFGWEGLLIKDTVWRDHFMKPEPYYYIHANQEVTQISDYGYQYNKLLFEPPRNPWQEYDNEEEGEHLEDNTDYESKNCRCMRTYGEYRIVGTDYYQVLENRKFNLRYMNSNWFSDIIIVDTNIPNWKIGDVVWYNRRYDISDDDAFSSDKVMIKSNEIFFAADSTNYVDTNGLKFSWTTKLLGLEQNVVPLE